MDKDKMKLTSAMVREAFEKLSEYKAKSYTGNYYVSTSKYSVTLDDNFKYRHITKVLNEVINNKIPDEVVIAEGEVKLCCTGYGGSLPGVYMTAHENGYYKDIGLNELLTESQAIELEGKSIRLKLEVLE